MFLFGTGTPWLPYCFSIITIIVAIAVVAMIATHMIDTIISFGVAVRIIVCGMGFSKAQGRDSRCHCYIPTGYYCLGFDVAM